MNWTFAAQHEPTGPASLIAGWFDRVFVFFPGRFGDSLQKLIVVHVSDDDLFEAMRLSGVTRLEDVAEARKERSGEISIIKHWGCISTPNW
jgi:hypothetical protein